MTGERKREDIIFLITGCVMLASEVWKQLVLTFVVGGGQYQWWYFPWQLCSVPMYLCVMIFLAGLAGEGCEEGKGMSGHRSAAAVCTVLRSAMVTFLADFTLMSGAAAFLDTSGFHYPYMPLTVHSYLWHIGLVLLGIYAGTRERDKSLRAFRPATVLYLIAVIAAELINLGLDRFGTINMFYINPHYRMGQIVFRSLTELMPNTVVILLYVLSCIAGGFLVHCLWRLRGNRENPKD